jgi:hypothetical protein
VRELAHRLRGAAGEVVIHERHDGHALRQELDPLGVGRYLVPSINDDVVQLWGQSINRVSLPL